MMITSRGQGGGGFFVRCCCSVVAAVGLTHGQVVSPRSQPCDWLHLPVMPLVPLGSAGVTFTFHYCGHSRWLLSRVLRPHVPYPPVAVGQCTSEQSRQA